MLQEKSHKQKAIKATMTIETALQAVSMDYLVAKLTGLCTSCKIRKAPKRRSECYSCLTVKLRTKSYDALGGAICSCPGCLEIHPERLCIDHVKGNGAGKKERDIYGRSSRDQYSRINRAARLGDLEALKEWRVLCQNCNAVAAKGKACLH